MIIINGSVSHDWDPFMVDAGDVERREASAIPVSLRDHAHATLPLIGPGQWWTIGEFRDHDGEFATAVATRTASGPVLYGISD